MKITPIFRRSLQVLQPATLLLAACSKKEDTPVPVVTPTGSILFVNAAANVFVPIKAYADGVALTTLTYGVNGGGATPLYQTVNAGTPSIRVDNDATSTTFFTQTPAVAKDQKYSFFIYSPNTTVTPTGLLTSDDLTAPTAGKAKIRLVHVAQGFPSTSAALSLSQVQPVGFLPLTSAVAFANASPFVEINSATSNLVITTGTSPAGTTVLSVGDGTGTGTGNKNYEAGKIYTIIVRGTDGNQDPTRQPKAFIIQNN